MGYGFVLVMDCCAVMVWENYIDFLPEPPGRFFSCPVCHKLRDSEGCTRLRIELETADA